MHPCRHQHNPAACAAPCLAASCCAFVARLLLHVVSRIAGLPGQLQVSVLQLSTWSWWLLWAAAVLAVWSLSMYFVNVWAHFVAPQAKKVV